MKYYNTATKRSLNDEDGSDGYGGSFRPFPVNCRKNEETGQSVFSCYIQDRIESPYDFISINEAFIDAKEGDVFNIYLQSPGGCLYSTDVMLNAIANAEYEGVDVNIIATGSIASAGTMILLSTSNPPLLSPNTTLLFHCGEIGLGGTMNEFKIKVEHILPHSKEIFKRVYEHFLTEEEIEAMFDGRAICMGAEEFYVRWECRHDVLLEQHLLDNPPCEDVEENNNDVSVKVNIDTRSFDEVEKKLEKLQEKLEYIERLSSKLCTNTTDAVV